jgi:hypothetical protein
MTWRQTSASAGASLNGRSVPFRQIRSFLLVAVPKTMRRERWEATKDGQRHR